ncbi:hypothetical protein Avbf_10391 [Armadillidium vulgare]|nr:hypothetical protein Avbf_10391 [Armadillidium vulgare]
MKRSSFEGDMKRDSESHGVAEKTPSGTKNEGGDNGEVEIGGEANYFDSDVPYNDYNSVPDQEPPSVPIDHSWEINLDLLSMDLLASVEVSWEYRGSESVDYLVSWTESSGGISGHMVTKQDRVEISLWSGQHYSIQVELLDQHGNSVLRSMPKTISFGSPEPSASATSTPAPKRNLTSTVKSTTTTTIFTFSTVGYPPIIRRKDYNPDFTVGKEDRDAILRDSQKHLIPERPSTSTISYSELPPWKNEASYNHVSLSNSRKDATQPQTPQGETSSQLMTWAACLGVGAVVILILIIWAVRTLRKSTTAREENRRAEDYLSETTASSVNSSNITTCSHLSRGSRVGRESEEPPWTYETFYRVNNTPLTIQALQRPPPPPLHSPPSPPIQHVHTVVPMPGSMGIPFNHHSHQFPINSVQHINQLPLNTHVNSMPLSQISLGTHGNQVTPSSSGVTHAIAVSTPISVNPSLVNNLPNRNCCGNL